MSITGRQKRIQECPAGDETLTVDDAVRIFQVSPATIRRDFAKKGLSPYSRTDLYW